MNRRILTTLIICGTITGGMLEPAMAGRGKCGKKCGRKGGGTPAPAAVLAEAEARDLLFMREEEKLARDVYMAMRGLYDQRVFINIPKSEQHHMEAIQGLCEKYGVSCTVLEPGHFRNEELQKLYDTLVERGSASRADAFLVGALVEEVDIQDLRERVKRARREDIKAVYENLESGSMRHLNAFIFNYQKQTGKTYAAQHLTKSEVDEILDR